MSLQGLILAANRGLLIGKVTFGPKYIFYHIHVAFYRVHVAVNTVCLSHLPTHLNVPVPLACLYDGLAVLVHRTKSTITCTVVSRPTSVKPLL